MPIIRIFQGYGKSGENRRKQKSNQQVIKTLERKTARNAYKKLYGPRVMMIGAREKTLDFDVPEEFVAEFRDAECDYVLYRLDGNVTYRKPEN